MRYLLLATVYCLLVACDQVTNIHLHQLAPSPVTTRLEAPPHVCDASCPPSHAPEPVPQPVLEPVCDEAFKVRDHTQWVNTCGTSEEKAPIPAPTPKPTPIPPSCRTGLGC